jgi:hypothetical protein
MFQEGTFVQYRQGKHIPYRVHIAIGYQELGSAMPDAEQHSGFNVYALYDEHDRLIQVYEHQLEPWTPRDEDEAWVCQLGPKTWIEYQWCKKASEWLGGLPRDILMRRIAEREQAS